MDIIKIYDENNNPKEYKVLLIIDSEYKYIIYTDPSQKEIDKGLMVAKVKSLENVNETIPIRDDEWKMIEKEYQKLLANKNSE